MDDTDQTIEPPEATGEPVAEICVAHQNSGERVDAFLARRFPERSRAYFQRCIHQGRIQIKGRSLRPADTLKTNEVITIDWPPEQQFRLTAEQVPFDILYEDEDVLVINKPAGLVVHPAKGNWTGTLVQGLLAHSAEDFGEMVDEEMRPGIVHRLDQHTSGAMVIAKNPAAREALRRTFADRDVEKLYLAIVTGEFGSTTGKIVGNIGRHPIDRKKMAVLKAGGKPAESHYRVLATVGEVSLLEVKILTGRTHQIRVHCASINHPVLGDPVYGGRQRELPVHAGRQMLHAWKLSFPHPRTGVLRTYLAPLPADFLDVLHAAGITLFSHLPPPVIQDNEDSGELPEALPEPPHASTALAAVGRRRQREQGAVSPPAPRSALDGGKPRRDAGSFTEGSPG
jgi:23S rRNA pseudouridine1911/1915/1917 synthase